MRLLSEGFGGVVGGWQGVNEAGRERGVCMCVCVCVCVRACVCVCVCV